MTREEKVKFVIESVKEFEGVTITKENFKDMSDEQLDREVAWMEYLWEK